MIAGGVTLPDKCPDKCPGHDEYPGQGGLCARCPLFNCLPCKEDDGTEFRLLEPEDYNKEWAAEWKRWFDAGMKGLPCLRFKLASFDVASGDGKNRNQH